jgi:hypothetical protein
MPPSAHPNIKPTSLPLRKFFDVKEFKIMEQKGVANCGLISVLVQTAVRSQHSTAGVLPERNESQKNDAHFIRILIPLMMGAV